MRMLQNHIFEEKGASGCLSSTSQFPFLSTNGRDSSHTPQLVWFCLSGLVWLQTNHYLLLELCHISSPGIFVPSALVPSSGISCPAAPGVLREQNQARSCAAETSDLVVYTCRDTMNPQHFATQDHKAHFQKSSCRTHHYNCTYKHNSQS